MIEISLDASQLDLFEICPRKWFYSSVLNLVPNHSHRAFDIGSYYHEVLAHYYSTSPHSNRWQSTVDYAAQSTLFDKYNIRDSDERKFHRKRLIEYFNRYEYEDQEIEVIGVEQGFSWLLYEDAERRYILEGKIDLVCNIPRQGLTVMDHKTQSRKDDRWEFNHQVCNYLCATKANNFIYNYIGLQNSLPPDGMRRCPYQPHEGMLEQWKKEVKMTFDRMYEYKEKTAKKLANVVYYQGIERAESIADLVEEQEYPRQRSACDFSKYGLCQFHKLCSVPDDSKWVPAVLSAYKEKAEVWRPWS